jgi:putative oxidoreductase
MKLGVTILRAVVGGTFIAHGVQKLFGWFGGPGLEGMATGLEQMGLRPGKRNALIAGTAETGGGALLATGFLTPLGAAAVLSVMHQAVRTVHWQKGFFNTAGGYEYNLVISAAVVALVDAGPGPLSVDRALGTERSGPLWALAALGAGIAGPRLLERLAPAEEPAEESRFTREPEGVPAPA